MPAKTEVLCKFHLCSCMQVLIDWINDVLVGERIIVKDLAEDLYDGQVLQKLFGIVTLLSSKNITMHHIIPRLQYFYNV